MPVSALKVAHNILSKVTCIFELASSDFARNWLELKKPIVIFEIRTLEFLIVKCREIMEMPKLGTKSPYLGIFGLEFYKTIVIFEVSTFELV